MQLLQKAGSPPVGDGIQAPGLGLCKMGPADDPDAFLGTFERVALGAGWDRTTWALRVAPYLAGEAQAASMTLSEEQARSYDTVKASVLDQVGLLDEKYCQRFWAAKRTGDLRPRALTQKLMDQTTRRLRAGAQTIEEVMDALVLEHFLQRLPERTRVWVRRHQPGTVEAAVKLTEDYVEAVSPRKEGHPYKDEDPGRKSRDTLNGKGLEKKRETNRGAPTGTRQLMCWQCGRVGHKKQDCPDMDCGFAEFCGWTNSGGQGKGRKLSTIPVRVGRRPQRGLVDSASACSLVRRLVKLQWIIPGAKINLGCILGDERQCPMAQVPFKVWGWFCWKQDRVVEGLPYPVVEGTDWDPWSRGKGDRARRPKVREGGDPLRKGEEVSEIENPRQQSLSQEGWEKEKEKEDREGVSAPGLSAEPVGPTEPSVGRSLEDEARILLEGSGESEALGA
ncbi:uncharacterized protein LOC122457205 [Dermochelys coriacea]|uniref:uncharacterized protein LOC122457205 n=1 Tax=Dermochelys coriacea TaxID=27794 RepID=UPI001CA83FA5|nr:uncharacterized protein LOC122457205 [Dermochelys coriacea]XP_043356885.1 uncharacterized protein LOC122457205 [Dermochelys coriacea]XP_043356886.1 uncharacterized protein LOC122457205 [Dermochelys coriacea]